MIKGIQARVTITVVTHLVSFVSGRKYYSEKKTLLLTNLSRKALFCSVQGWPAFKLFKIP